MPPTVPAPSTRPAIRAGFWSRAWSWLVRARELWPITLRGLGVLACVGLALWYFGFGALDGVWYVAGLVLLGLCTLSLLSVCAAAVRMRVALGSIAREGSSLLRTETARPTDTSFAVPRLRFWMFVDVELAWLEPVQAEVIEQREGAWLREQVVLSQHGEVRRVLRRVIVRDVFGLSSIALRHESRAELDVLPHAGALRALPLLRSLAGGDDIPHPMGIAQGDRLELRRYAPGDPARFIHWKAYARTHKLVVRMPERALSRAHRVAAYLVAGAGDGASAAAARVALEEGALGTDFRFGADGVSAPVDRTDAALVSIMRSGAARADSAAGLRAFVDAVEREGPASLVLFVPPKLGARLERVREVIRQRSRPVRVVIGIDGLVPARAPSLLARLALDPERSARVLLDDLRDDLAAYRRLGCDVVVLDRESGRVLGEAHLTHAARLGSREQAA